MCFPQLLTTFWSPVLPCCLWDISSPTVVTLLFGLHCLSWYLVYASCLLLDLPDLLGLRDVYYGVSGFGDPRANVSPRLGDFMGRFRHGSFTGFLVIAFARPTMGLDRLLMALACAWYMRARWRPRRREYEYQRSMWDRKQRQMGNGSAVR